MVRWIVGSISHALTCRANELVLLHTDVIPYNQGVDHSIHVSKAPFACERNMSVVAWGELSYTELRLHVRGRPARGKPQRRVGVHEGESV